MLSLATDASETTKPKVNSKAAKEDTDSVGVDVRFNTCLPLQNYIQYPPEDVAQRGAVPTY